MSEGWLGTEPNIGSFPRKLEAAALDLVRRAARKERSLRKERAPQRLAA